MVLISNVVALWSGNIVWTIENKGQNPSYKCQIVSVSGFEHLLHFAVLEQKWPNHPAPDPGCLAFVDIFFVGYDMIFFFFLTFCVCLKRTLSSNWTRPITWNLLTAVSTYLSHHKLLPPPPPHHHLPREVWESLPLWMEICQIPKPVRFCFLCLEADRCGMMHLVLLIITWHLLSLIALPPSDVHSVWY